MSPQTQSGGTLEQTVKGTFASKGFVIVPYQEWVKDSSKCGDELLLMRAPYATIYNHKGYTEFLLKSKKYGREIRIECKWQQVSGSVDEKLPYLYLNIIRCPEPEFIVIIDGAGWKKGAVEWLKSAVAARAFLPPEAPLKRVEVFSLTEFLTWANNEFR